MSAPPDPATSAAALPASPDPPPPGDSPGARGSLALDRAAAALAALLLLALFARKAYQFHGYYVDDAFITMRFARNLAEGHGLVFNPGGPPVEGFSNPTLMLFEAAAIRLGIDALNAAKALSLAATLFLAISSCGLAKLWLRHAGLVPGRDVALAALPAGLALCLLSPTAVLGAMAGLETNLFVALLTGAFWLALRAVLPAPPDHAAASPELVTRNSSLVTSLLPSLLLALAVFTRPEGFLWALGVGLAALLLAAREPGRPALRIAAIILAAGLAAWIAQLAWRLAIFGVPFPNTYYAKTAGPLAARFLLGLATLVPWLLEARGAILLVLAALAVALLPRGRRLPAAVGLLAVIAQLLVTASEGRDWMPGHRLVVPCFGILAALASVAVALLARRIAPSRPLLLGAVLSLGLIVASPPLLRANSDRVYNLAFMSWLGWEDAHAPLGLWLRTWRLQRPTQELKIAIYDIGIVGWVSRAEIVDLAALVDPQRARAMHRTAGREPYPVETLLNPTPSANSAARPPECIVLLSSTRPDSPAGITPHTWTPDAFFLGSPRFRQLYTLHTYFRARDTPGNAYYLVVFVRNDLLAEVPPASPPEPRVR